MACVRVRSCQLPRLAGWRMRIGQSGGVYFFIPGLRMRRGHSGGVYFYPRVAHAQRTQLWIIFLPQAGACAEDTAVE